MFSYVNCFCELRFEVSMGKALQMITAGNAGRRSKILSLDIWTRSWKGKGECTNSQPICFRNPTSQCSNPFPFLTLFLHFQWPNLNPSGLNSIFPDQKPASPNSHLILPPNKDPLWNFEKARYMFCISKYLCNVCSHAKRNLKLFEACV